MPNHNEQIINNFDTEVHKRKIFVHTDNSNFIDSYLSYTVQFQNYIFQTLYKCTYNNIEFAEQQSGSGAIRRSKAADRSDAAGQRNNTG